MLGWSAGLLAAGAALGVALVILSQTVQVRRHSLWPGALHGVVGLAAFGLLLLGLRGPALGLQQGAASFGLIAAWLVAAALAFGALLALMRRVQRGPAMLVVGIHATVGVAGLVMLLAYITA